MKLRSIGSLVVLAFAVAFAAPFEARAHTGSVIEGTFTRIFGDPHPTLRPEMRQQRLPMITADDGHIVPLDLSAVAPPTGGWNKMNGGRIRVTTDASVASEALGPNDRFRVRSFVVVEPARASSFEAVTGNQKYISLLCKFAGVATEPQTPAWFTDQVNLNTYPHFNHYFQEVSYGTLTLTDSTATSSWLTLPKSKAQYIADAANNPNLYLPAMFTDCTGLHNSTVNFAQFYGINMMFNDKVDDCCAWGGTIGAVLDGINGPNGQGWPVTWMPYWGPGILFGWNDHGVLAHEMSHAFGSGHSKDPTGYEYGNSWDVVSDPCGLRGGFDVTYDLGPNGLGCVGQHEIAHNKLSMGIIPGARIASKTAGSALTTHNIERLAQPLGVGGTVQVLKIQTSDPNHYYTVESRQRIGYDLNLPGDGVLIHNVIVTPAVFLDAEATLVVPSGTGGGTNAIWPVGSTYTNATYNFKVTVNSYSVDGTANITVKPATDPGEYSFALAGYTVIEGGPAINVAVTRTAPFTAAGSVQWTTSNGTAAVGTDFGTLANLTQKTGTLTWLAGTGGTKNITVGLGTSNIPVINDTTSEANRAFNIALSSPVGGILGAQASTSVDIQDSESTINFANTAVPVNENAGNVVLTVTRTGSTALAQTVYWTTANGTALAGSDFGTLASTLQKYGTLNFPAGSVASQTITIPILNDAVIEGPETFTVTLSLPTSGAILGTDKVATVTINSEDAGVTMAAATRSFTEGDGAQEIYVNRSGPGTGAASVHFVVNNGTAIRGTHFDSAASGDLTWADGDVTPKWVSVTINNDGAVNANRTFSVTLSLPSAGTILAAPMTTTATIVNDDNTVQFSLPTATVAEGTASAIFTVTRTGSTLGAADVTWTANNGSAIAGTDFGILGNATAPSGALHWDAGSATSRTVTIPILNDLIVEGAKNFYVQLSAPVQPTLSIGTNSQVTVTLNDNDKGIAFKDPTYQATEGTNPSVTLVVQRIGPATTAATATWATVNGPAGPGGAESGKDFGLLNNFLPRTGTISWLAGDAANKNIVIPIINDTLGGEGDETFTVVLTPGVGLVLGTPGIATVTIHDNDIPPQTNVQFAEAKYVVLESIVNAVLTVQRVDLGPGFGLTSTVNYATVAGTALATSDYMTKTGTLTWLPGDNTDKTISIVIVNNTLPEGPESFKVVLSAPNPGTGFGTPTEASVLILDDDEAFPLDGLMPAGFSTAAAATTGWHVSNDPGAYEGAFALKSNEIDDNESAGIEMNGTFAAGNVSFRVKVSTEAGFDKLLFFIDGVLQTTWSGTTLTGWQMSPSYPLIGGVHTLSWVYLKDSSVSSGLDAVYLDGLVTPAFTP